MLPRSSYGKAINIYFGKLLFSTNQHEISFVIITFELIRKHPFSEAFRLVLPFSCNETIWQIQNPPKSKNTTVFVLASAHKTKPLSI